MAGNLSSESLNRSSDLIYFAGLGLLSMHKMSAMNFRYYLNTTTPLAIVSLDLLTINSTITGKFSFWIVGHSG